MKLGVGSVLTGLVLGAIAVTAGGVHALWSSTAERSSRVLAAAINERIVEAVRNEVSESVAEATSAFTAVRTLFFQNVLETREADKREFVFLSQLQSQPSVSWVAFGWPDGDFFAAHKLGDDAMEMMEISLVEGTRQRRVDRYRVLPEDIQFEERHFEPASYRSTDQLWYQLAISAEAPQWVEIEEHPTGTRSALAYAGPIDVYAHREGVLAVIIEFERLSRFLSTLNVGESGRAFILHHDGSPVAVPDPRADEVLAARFAGHPLLPIAREALRSAVAASTHERMEAPTDVRLRISGEMTYLVSLTPLDRLDWTIATVVPEEEFLGDIRATRQRLLVGLAIFVAAAALFALWIGRRFLTVPMAGIVEEIRHVETFEPQRVRHRPSPVRELDNVSHAIAGMAAGLVTFRKYLPAELVRTLLAQGVVAEPGGESREISIMFVDIAGFTGMSERMGDGVLPVLGDYLDRVSRIVDEEGGTVDKFIGDAVMAFWNAPVADPDHALNACRAALRIIAAFDATPSGRQALSLRVGINTGRAIVGNVGSPTRLNYTAIGDSVNIASRLEGANKVYGTSIIVSQATAEAAGEGILTRRLDHIVLHGRDEKTSLFELIGLGNGAAVPEWVRDYEKALAAYDGGALDEARDLCGAGLARHPQDAPLRRLAELCRAGLAERAAARPVLPAEG